MDNNTMLFIVENALNSSSIDSLFVSLFYKPSYIQNILSEYPKNISFVYLQELIYENFVCNMRRNYFIDAATINEIRNYMVLCGLGSGADMMTTTCDVQELYAFLINGFYKSNLNFKFKEKGGFTIDYIELKVTKNACIKTLLDDYFNESIGEYCLEEVPHFIPIYLNRTAIGKFNNCAIDVKEGIYISKNNIDEAQKKVWWKIHSIICHSGGAGGHYYAIVSDGNNWHLFNHSKLPALLKIDIKNEDIATKIKQECVFIFYTLNG